MATYGGWAGKVLHVDLSTGRIWTDDTIERYKDYLGGTGIGYKVMWDEVPAGTKPHDPDNRIIFAVGPLAGTGAPCNGRTAITTLWPTCWPQPLVATGHMGGQFAAKLKYAGYDAIVIKGRADRPVWLSIVDQQVVIQDARRLWGQGIRRTTLAISQIMGPEAVVAAIGPAGENLVPMSNVMNSVSHSAGGIGSVMGSKNLKAIGIVGTGSVRIAGDKGQWEKLIKYHLSLLGANNQHVVPSAPQPWAEFYDPSTRWKGGKGRVWGAAPRPIATGTCEPHNLNRIAYRTNNAAFFLGDIAWQYTVRGAGCTSCPIRCHTMIKVPSVSAKYGIPDVGQNTCAGLNFGRAFFKKFPDGPRGQTNIEACMVGMHLADDLGIWCNYSQLQRDFQKLYYEGFIRKKLSEAEFRSYGWDKYEKGDPSFLFELLPRIAAKDGELASALGTGHGVPSGPLVHTRRDVEQGPRDGLLENGASEAPFLRRRRPVRGPDQSAVQPGCPVPLARELCAQRPALVGTEAPGRRNLGFARCSRRGRGVYAHASVKGRDGKMVGPSQGAARFALPLQLDGPLDSLAAQGARLPG